MKIFLCLWVFIFIDINLKAQNFDTSIINKKYLSAIKYVSKSKNLKNADNFFKKISKRNYPPNILTEIYPISLIMLNKNVIEEVIKPDTGNFSKIKVNEFILLYDKEHYFEPENYFKDDSCFKNKKSQLYLVFSKPEEKYLLAELYVDYYNNKPSDYQSFPKFGSYFKIVFLFDDNYRVISFFCNQVHQ